MSLRAPLRVPVELKRPPGGRWFRLALEVSTEGLSLGQAVPDELDGPLEVRFHLPGVIEPLVCHGEAVEVTVGEGADERAERCAVRFLDLDGEGAARIQAYVQERLGVS
jgi:hypothetical protein